MFIKSINILFTTITVVVYKSQIHVCPYDIDVCVCVCVLVCIACVRAFKFIDKPDIL